MSCVLDQVMMQHSQVSTWHASSLCPPVALWKDPICSHSLVAYVTDCSLLPIICFRPSFRRYEEERRQQEQEVLQACTFAPVVNRASTHLHPARPRTTVGPAPRPCTAGKVSVFEP